MTPPIGALRHAKEAASDGSVSDGQSEKLKASACGKRSFLIDRPGGGFISAGDEGHGRGWLGEKEAAEITDAHIPHGGEGQWLSRRSGNGIAGNRGPAQKTLGDDGLKRELGRPAESARTMKRTSTKCPAKLVKGRPGNFRRWRRFFGTGKWHCHRIPVTLRKV